MEKEDVLIGDIRVTALADEGSYSFEWEDENKKIITLADNCKFTEVPEHVRKVIEAHDLRIVESDLAQDTEETSESKKDKIISRGTDSLFSNPDSKSSGINTIEDTQSEESDKSEQEQQLISFTVRMSDPEERESVVKELKNSNQEAAKELQLTGPYKVTYDVSGSNIELVSVEDVGIGSSVK